MKNLLIALTGFMAAFAIAAAGQSTVVPPAMRTSSLSGSAASPLPVQGLERHNPRYRLTKSDSFDLVFTFQPEYNQTVEVQPDGYVTLKDVGSIYVAGETIPELTQTIKQAYVKIHLRDPEIAVSLRDFEKPYFIASGQVAKPGKYDLRGPITVTEAVALAGGFNDGAKQSQVVLFHPMSNGVFETKVINVKQFLASRDLPEDTYLHSGDMVYVPQSTISKIRKFMPSSAVGAYYNPMNF